MERRVTRPLGLLIILLFLGCASTYERIRPDTALVASRINREASVYVATSEDGRYGSILYTGSGIATTHAIRSAFLRHVTRVGMASTPASEEQVVTRARRDGYSHAVVPAIPLHWEDRATEWSGRSDRIEVRLTLIELASGKVLDVVHIYCKNSVRPTTLQGSMARGRQPLHAVPGQGP